MSLHKLVFDTTDSGTIADSSNVGAYVRGADGTLVTVTGTSLNTNLTNASIAVTATALDIRHLAFATDKVDASGSAVSITGTVAVTQSTSPWVVSATALDIRHLAAATDSVASWTKDGAGTAITSTTAGGKQALDVNIAATDIEINVEIRANTALTTAASPVSTSGALFTSPLANRKFVWMYNNGSKAVYIGPSGVSSASGFPLFPGSLLDAQIGAAVAIHAVASSGTQDVRVMQAS